MHVQSRLLALLAILCLGTSFGQIPPYPFPPSQDGDVVQKIQFPNADITAVFRFYEALTGKTLLWDSALQGTLNVVINKPLTKEEAIKVLETSFLLSGFSLIPGDGNIVKVVGLGKNPKGAGVPIYSEPDQIPRNDRVITYLFKLQYADAQELATILQSYIGSAMTTYSSIVPLSKAQILMVTESSTVIKGLFQVISEVDVPPATVVSEFLTLQRAEARDILEKLQKIFEKPQSAGSTPLNVPIFNRQNPENPGQPGGNLPTSVQIGGETLSEGSIIVGAIKLTADVRTNRIHVITRPINLPFIRKLVKEFDEDSTFGEPIVRPLKYVSAADVLNVVVKAIAEPGEKTEETSAQQGSDQNSTGAKQNQNTNQGGAGGNNGTGDSTGAQGFTEELSAKPRETTPQAVTVGSTKIIADNRANSIIVLGTKEVAAKICRVLDDLDVRPYQVLLNTVIGELTLSDGQEFGVDYLLRTGGGILSGSNSTGTTTSRPPASTAAISRNTNATLLDPSSLLTASSLAAAGSGFTAYIAPVNSLETIVRALDSTQRFHITTRPMVFTSNNQKAIIASGQEIAVPVSSLTSFSAGVTTPATSSSIEFKRVATQLEVVPLINSDREVSLDILQKIDSVNGSTTVDNNQIPTIQTRYIKTNVNVPNKATVVLGGLITKNYTNNQSGLPYLSKIPVLGWLFKDKSTSKTRTELIILIRPVVTATPTETVLNRQREEERLNLEPDLDSTLTPHGGKVRPQQREESPIFR